MKSAPRRRKITLLSGLVIPVVILGVGYVFYLKSAPSRFIDKEISILKQLPPPGNQSGNTGELFRNPEHMEKRFGDGSWAIWVCGCESSGDAFNATVLTTSDGSALFTRQDVDGYEGFSQVISQAKNADDLKKSLLSSGYWQEWKK